MKPDGLSDKAYKELHIFIAKLEKRRQLQNAAAKAS